MPTDEIRPAATLLLVRDAAQGLEVFMVKRHHAIDFVPGAMVFPGGKVDPGDDEAARSERFRGAPELDHAARAFRVAAIRESFEECGILLARARGEQALVDDARTRAIEAKHRDALNANETTIGAIAEAEDLELAGDLPVHFAHWITPNVMPKRFDTHFFLVETPAGQTAVHDGGESVDSVWVTPQAAMAEEAAGNLNIIFPTLMQLKKLARYGSVRDAIVGITAEPVVTVLPEIVKRDGGFFPDIPAEAGYDLTDEDVAAFMKLAGKPA